MTTYQEFLERKALRHVGAGLEVDHLPPKLYPWQQAIVRWALRKGRSAIFADCGLGKTFMQVAWAQALNVPTLIVAPLCVADQTVREAERLGVSVNYETSSTRDHRITITNYERIDKFDPARYQAVVLDESSILKSFDGKTRTRLIEMFRETPYRLCCTATPSPNDIAELANHAEFLGLMTRPEFLATWFVHDDSGWRMKRHAVTPFYRWLASWAVSLRSPSDLGFDDAGFELPPLRIHDAIVDGGPVEGSLFPELSVKGIHGRLSVRRGSLSDRVDRAAEILSSIDGQCIVWCGLNSEADAMVARVPGAVNVQGNDSYAEKVSAIRGFLDGSIRVLVTKPKILGFGMNFQHCAAMIFLGLSDSYESYYQCIRRCWRFGQHRPVNIHVVVSDAEQFVVENVRRKQHDAEQLTRQLVAHSVEFEREEIMA